MGTEQFVLYGFLLCFVKLTIFWFFVLKDRSQCFDNDLPVLVKCIHSVTDDGLHDWKVFYAVKIFNLCSMNDDEFINYCVSQFRKIQFFSWNLTDFAINFNSQFFVNNCLLQMLHPTLFKFSSHWRKRQDGTEQPWCMID